MPFKPGEGRPAFNISETQIRYAMEHSKSCAEAARFLKISYEAFRKYAKLYKDESTGKTLFEIHKNQKGAGMEFLKRNVVLVDMKKEELQIIQFLCC